MSDLPVTEAEIRDRALQRLVEIWAEKGRFPATWKNGRWEVRTEDWQKFLDENPDAYLKVHALTYPEGDDA